MYRLVKESSIYYKSLMSEDSYRKSLVEPLILLIDIDKFNKAKESQNTEFINLCELISKMKKLHASGDERFHNFANFLREVEDEGFDIGTMDCADVPESEKLKDQIELIRMFMSFKYCPHYS